MATEQLITADNYSTLLVRSTQSRSGTPDGNIYFDTTNDVIELITASELANVDLGSGAEANPLTDALKIQMLAVYFFLLDEAESDTSLQNFVNAVDAVGNRMGRLVGANALLSGYLFASNDHLKIADSGFTAFGVGGSPVGSSLVNRIYHGAKAQGTVHANTQCYYLLAASSSESDRQAAAPVNFSTAGAFNEVIQTFGDTANGDAGAGDFDYRGRVLIINARQFGYTASEVSSAQAVASGELGAYLQGYAFSQSAVSALSGISSSDVFGGSAIAPYTGITFDRLAVAQTETGFNEADGDFTDVVSNSASATLTQVRARMDMWMLQDANINDTSGTTGAFLPKRAEPLYTINSLGKLVTRQGLFIENLPVADQQNVIFTDDAGDEKTYPSLAGVDFLLSAAWFDDSAQWFRVMYEDGASTADFDTANAVTVNDASDVALAGDNSDIRIISSGSNYILRVSYAYDSNTQAGLSAGEDKDIVIQVGGVTSKRRTIYATITSSASQTIDCTSEAETNAA